MSFNYF